MSDAIDQYGMFHARDELMEGVKTYILSIVAVSILCGILLTLVGSKGPIPQALKLLMGIFVAVTVLRPVVQIRLNGFSNYIGAFAADGRVVAGIGEEMAMAEAQGIIKQQVQAYILDKATALGAALDAEVTIDGYTPVQVTLTGSVSPYAKAQLTDWIAETLGIPKEAQRWNG